MKVLGSWSPRHVWSSYGAGCEQPVVRSMSRSRFTHRNTWRVVVLVPVVIVSLWLAALSGSPSPRAASAESAGATSTSASTTTADDDGGGSGATAVDSADDGTDVTEPSDATASDDPVTVTAITPWVTSEGEFQLRFDTTTAIPPDSQLTYTIHQALQSGARQDLRDAVTTVIMGGQAGRILQTPVTRPLADFATGDGSYVLSIPVRSRSSADRERAFLPISGVHPISIVLTSADGPELWSTIVFLNHLPRGFDSDPDDFRSITVTLLTPVRTGPIYTSGSPEFDVHDRAELDSLTNLLRGTPGVPLKLALQPDVLAGLAERDDIWAESTLDDIRNALDPDTADQPADDETDGETDRGADGVPTEQPDTGPELIVSPFTRPDTNGMATAGGRDVLGTIMSLGQRIAAHTQARQLVSSSWVLDDHLGPESVGSIESLGVSEVVVPADRLQPDPRAEARTPSPSPSRLGGSSSMRVLGYDDLLSSILTNTVIAPVNRSHDVLTALMADWFQMNASRQAPSSPASAIIVTPTVDPITVAALGSALDGSGPLRSPPAGSLLPAEDAGTGDGSEQAATVSLTNPPTTDGISRVVNGFRETDAMIRAYESAAAEEPLIDGWRLRNADSLSVGLGTSDVDHVHSAIASEIQAKIDAITAPPARRLVLGSRDTTIPLRFKNDLPYPVQLTLRARSPRLELVGGDSTLITLEPGDNVIDLPVLVRAPGESLLRIQIETPKGGLAIAATSLPVRSTAISGVGAALSILSIVFIILWWARTFITGRREQASESDTTTPTSRHDD